MDKNIPSVQSNKKSAKKWTIAIIAIIVLGFLGMIFSQIFPITIMSQYFTVRNIVEDNLNKIDKYHGESPEDLYAKLLSALEKKDIDLFIKYVDREKQEEIREILNNIAKNEDVWAQMMSHVGNTEMNFIERVSSDHAILKIVDKDNFSVANFTLIKKIGENYSF